MIRLRVELTCAVSSARSTSRQAGIMDEPPHGLGLFVGGQRGEVLAGHVVEHDPVQEAEGTGAVRHDEAELVLRHGEDRIGNLAGGRLLVAEDFVVGHRLDDELAHLRLGDSAGRVLDAKAVGHSGEQRGHLDGCQRSPSACEARCRIWGCFSTSSSTSRA